MRLTMLNKIHVTDDEIQELFKWKEQNKDKVRDLRNVPVQEGIITLEGFVSIYFRKHDNVVELKYFNDDKVMLKFRYNVITWAMFDRQYDKDFIHDFANDLGNPDEQHVLEELTKDVISTYAIIMAYLNEDIK